MKLSIRDLYETLQDLEASGLLEGCDGEVTIVYQPTYPLAESATGCGWIVRNGTVELVIGAGYADSNRYADSIQTQSFDGPSGELTAEEDDEE